MQEESSPPLKLEYDESSFVRWDEMLLPVEVNDSPVPVAVNKEAIEISKNSISVEVLSKMQVSVDFNKSPALSADKSLKNEILQDAEEEKRLDTQDGLNENKA